MLEAGAKNDSPERELKAPSFLFFFGSDAVKKAMAANCRRLHLFGYVATKKVIAATTVAFIFLVMLLRRR